MTYETLSETEFGLDQFAGGFRPNLFVDITDYLHKKMNLLSIYESEMGDHPFPRSLDAVSSQALLRGAQRGVHSAEAFQLLRNSTESQSHFVSLSFITVFLIISNVSTTSYR